MPPSLLTSSEPEEHYSRFWFISSNMDVGDHFWKWASMSRLSPRKISSSSSCRRRSLHYAGADRINRSGNFVPDNTGNPGRIRIQTLARHNVGKIDPAGPDPNPDLAPRRSWIGGFTELQFVWATVTDDEDLFSSSRINAISRAPEQVFTKSRLIRQARGTSECSLRFVPEVQKSMQMPTCRPMGLVIVRNFHFNGSEQNRKT
jgi:hypothetical protein